MASLRTQVLGGYKRVLRAGLVAFKDDTMMINHSRKQLKVEVLKHKDVTDPDKLVKLVKGFEEVEEMLLINVTQARLNERGNYAAKLKTKRVSEQQGGAKVLEMEHIDAKSAALPTDVEVTPGSSPPQSSH